MFPEIPNGREKLDLWHRKTADKYFPMYYNVAETTLSDHIPISIAQRYLSTRYIDLACISNLVLSQNDNSMAYSSIYRVIDAINPRQ